MSQNPTSFGAMKMKRLFLKRTRLHKIFARLPRFLTDNRFPGVPGSVHTLDLMLAPVTQAGLDHYLSVGASALANIEETLTACNRTFADVRTCLDLPCGHGRVLRWLQGRIRPEGISACEIDREAADFCHQEFGVKALYSSDDPRQITFPDTYDLIWVGSLFSHLGSEKSFALFERFVEILNPGGVMVFTTQGESCFTNPGVGGYSKRFPAIEGQLRESYARDGYCHTPYQPGGYYGMAIYSEDYLKRTMAERFPGRVRLARFAARGWDHHQDVWSYQKT
jgi:SAM-dependent methyltransferase